MSHSHLHETLTLNRLLISLIMQILLDPSTHRDWAIVVVTGLGVRYAQQDKLLTDFAHVPFVGEHQLALSDVS